MGFTLQPITRETCFSQPELDKAVKHIKSKKNIIILGPDKIGKSSFLLHISDNLPNNFTPIILSAENCISLSSYIRKNLLSLMQSFSTIFKQPEELFSLSFIELDRRIAELKLSDNAKQKLKLLLFFEHDPKTDLDDVITAFYDIPLLLAAETKTAALVMIDDAHLLPGIKSDKTSLSGFLDRVKQKQENAVFVLASALPLQLDGFEELQLRPFPLDSAREFLKKNGLELNEPALTTLYNITEGVPFYLNFFARLMKGKGAAEPAAITAAVDDSLSNELHVYYSAQLKLLSPRELPILFCMAEHKVSTPSRISKLLNYSQTNVRRFLSIMEEKGFVTLKERGVFGIHDPVFRRWLEKQSR